MHIMLVADGRSPITRRYLNVLLELGFRVTLVSSFPCAPVEGVEGLWVLPVAFGRFAGTQSGAGLDQPHKANQGARRAVARFRKAFLSMRYWVGPLTLPFYAGHLRRIYGQVRPDVVHALRIPFEGMMASSLPDSARLIVSIWGNDLTLHAQGSLWMKLLTRRVLSRAQGLTADAYRDIRLARTMGFNPSFPSAVFPGAGGIDLQTIERIKRVGSEPRSDPIPAGVPLVINPRGFRPGSVRNDVFFSAIPLVLQRNNRVAFICPAMAGQPEAEESVRRLGIHRQVVLLPHLPQENLWELFLRATVMVSISQHDGTPNSLLEAMAAGCFPVVGDIESIREWITPGVNGLLVPPDRADQTAEAIVMALENTDLRVKAREINRKLIEERAEVGKVKEQILAFYQRFAG
ncbi:MULTISPECIES: glycosyltransferase [Anaerolinea]|uniref:glycosyltransferase n=1 Tax=Anaerolinea TaxID=233189 RepID=UPI00261310BA|nr:glycosyltransferase [Anaerolinea thermophila]